MRRETERERGTRYTAKKQHRNKDKELENCRIQ